MQKRLAADKTDTRYYQLTRAQLNADAAVKGGAAGETEKHMHERLAANPNDERYYRLTRKQLNGIRAHAAGPQAAPVPPSRSADSVIPERGARATDVVILVVAIDAGVQPTTIQAIEFARDMNLPIVVAANKIDRPDAEKQLTKLKSQLLEYGIVPEELGGEVPVVGVSATKRINLD